VVGGQGHVTPEISGRQKLIAPKRLKLRTSNLIHIGGQSGHDPLKFMGKKRCHSHVTPNVFKITLRTYALSRAYYCFTYVFAAVLLLHLNFFHA